MYCYTYSTRLIFKLFCETAPSFCSMLLEQILYGVQVDARCFFFSKIAQSRAQISALRETAPMVAGILHALDECRIETRAIESVRTGHNGIG